MKTKLVNRYYCDFCKKSGCSSYHMKRHENRCTLNPNRECGVCGFMTETYTGAPLAELIAILPSGPHPKFSYQCPTYRLFIDQVNGAMPVLRAAAGNCPACILSALRQSGIPLYEVEFEFKKEMEAVFKTVNEIAAENDYRAY